LGANPEGALAVEIMSSKSRIGNKNRFKPGGWRKFSGRGISPKGELKRKEYDTG